MEADGGPIFSSLYLSPCIGELNSIRMALSTGDLQRHASHDVTINTDNKPYIS